MKIVIDDVYFITGRGIVAAGKTKVLPKFGQVVEIIRPGRETWERTCMGVEQVNCMCTCCEKPVGVQLLGVKKGELKPGDTIVFSPI